MTVTGVVSTAVDSSFVRVRKQNMRMFEKLHKNQSAEQSAKVQTRPMYLMQTTPPRHFQHLHTGEGGRERTA